MFLFPLIVNTIKILGVFFTANYFGVVWVFWVVCGLFLLGILSRLGRFDSGRVTTTELVKIDFDAVNLALMVGGVVCAYIIYKVDPISAYVCFGLHVASSAAIVRMKMIAKEIIRRRRMK
jgi:hypothetical protein